MISVIMSLYNETREQLKESIRSVINQTYKDFEFIIVIDNPDEKWRIDFVKSFTDKRIRVLTNPKNLGLVKSLNRALGECKGEYIARMDADDISLPDRFEKQLEFLEKQGLDICGSNIISFNNNRDEWQSKLPTNSKRVSKVLRYANCVAHPTFFAKKEVYNKLNGYREIPYCEDYEFLCRALKKGFSIGNCKNVLLKYRINERGISKTNEYKQMAISNYVSKWYRKNAHDIEISRLDNYVKTKAFERECNMYKKASEAKNTFQKYAGRKNIKCIYYLFKYIMIPKVSFRSIYLKVVK